MNEYNDILIATDGSDVATDAATAGIALAETLSASVHALSVVEEGRGSDDRRKRREAYAKEVATRASEAGLESAAVVRAGRPASTVLEHADEVDADLIVVGTHGRTGLRQALLGSVALEVIRDARRPVLTVGAGAEGPVHLADGDVDDVCLATDGLTGSAAATEHALALADACDATLHVLYAVEPDGTQKTKHSARRSRNTARRRRLVSPSGPTNAASTLSRPSNRVRRLTSFSSTPSTTMSICS